VGRSHNVNIIAKQGTRPFSREKMLKIFSAIDGEPDLVSFEVSLSPDIPEFYKGRQDIFSKETLR
jgi:hypothetical protein